MARGQGTPARRKGVGPHESGGLHAWGGIVSGHLTDWAAAFDCGPEGVLQALQAAGAGPLVDTARSKNYEDHDRPEAPELRCLAVTADDARAAYREATQSSP
jgi:hypothetical protein